MLNMPVLSRLAAGASQLLVFGDPLQKLPVFRKTGENNRAERIKVARFADGRGNFGPPPANQVCQLEATSERSRKVLGIERAGHGAPFSPAPDLTFPLQQQLAAWLESTLLCDWPDAEEVCTRCGRDHLVEECPQPVTYELPSDMNVVTTGTNTTFEDLADWPEARKQ